jgi:predicted nuclease of restriction endonuclease-like (RecB) superfamily
MATRKKATFPAIEIYAGLIGGIGELLETARRASARSVNAVMTATYWEIGRRMVEFEQGGKKRAGYGEQLLKRLAEDLTERFGKGFSYTNLNKYRQFYFAYPAEKVRAALSRKSASAILPTSSGESAAKDSTAILPTASEELPSGTATPHSPAPLTLTEVAKSFPLPWSHYVLLLSARSEEARTFYHTEALRGGWSVRQLQRQMDSQFYERTALSRNKATVLAKGAKSQPGDSVSAEEEIRHPLVLEFLGLRDEYSETDLEDALVRHLETFLLELGNNFAFVGRQRRLRIDDEWYRVDLLFFHRQLRCLVIVDLKLGRFTHADAGQMNLYLNYARDHWVQPGENPPVGVILCSGKGEALVRYATEALPNKLLVREYLTALPDEKVLSVELEKTRKQLESRGT